MGVEVLLVKFSNLLQKLKFLVGSRLKLWKPANSVAPVIVWWFKCVNEASQVEFELGLGVANLEINYVYAHSFILSTKTFPRRFLIPVLILIIFTQTYYSPLNKT